MRNHDLIPTRHPKAYDYAGSWLNYVDNQANVYGGARTGFSTDAALTYYLNNGASASKINIGIPLYGRAYENTDGLGKSYSGVSSPRLPFITGYSLGNEDRPWNH